MPNTARMSSQLASFAGTTVIPAIRAVCREGVARGLAIWYNQSTQLVQPVLLSDRIHTRLRDQILSGELAPGAAVPSERRLSEQLGASRHAVREALKRLQEAGLIRISHGGATRVRDWRHDGGLDLLLALAAQGDVAARAGGSSAPRMELRACVGADAARRAAERASAAQRAEIVARAEALAAAAGPRRAQPRVRGACGTRSSTAPATSPTGSRSTR